MSVEVSSNLVKAADLAKAVLGDPSNTVSLALQHVAEEIQSGAATLTAVDIFLLRQLLAVIEKPATTITSLEVAKTESREFTPRGTRQSAIEIHVQCDSQMVRAVLFKESIGKSRNESDSIARGLGGRVAIREENEAVARTLLMKESNGNLNSAERTLLSIYRKNNVRDSSGCCIVEDRRLTNHDWHQCDYTKEATLFVFDLSASI